MHACVRACVRVFVGAGRLVNFLIQVASFERVNRASAGNIAVCFAPSLADADECTDAMDFMAVSSAIQSMLEFLVSTGRPFRLHGSWAESDSFDCLAEYVVWC